MTKIHPRLVDFVKVDFTQELKQGRELIELMGNIADNVDNILARHDTAASVSFLAGFEEADGDIHDDNTGEVRRTDTYGGQRGGFRGNNRGRGQPHQSGGRGGNNNRPGKVLHCPHCKYLSEALKLRISTNHEPTECYRKDIAVRHVTEENEEELYEEAEDFSGEHHVNNVSSSSYVPFQSNLTSPREESSFVSISHCNATLTPLPDLTDIPLSEQEVWDTVLKIQQARHQQDSGTAQADSPALAVSLHNNHTEATIDEGATINCMALKFALTCDLEIVETTSRAKGADSAALRVVGKTKKPVRLITTGMHGIPIVLKHVVVVDGLSADILIGEPGKRDCQIVTNATQKIITIHFQEQDYIFPYLKPRGPSSRVARARETVFIPPGKKDSYKWRVPEEFSKLKHLHFQPRARDREWFSPGVYSIQDGYIGLENITGDIIGLKRGAVFAEIRMVETLNVEDIRKVHYTFPDQTQYQSQRDKKLAEENHVDKVQIDPGNILKEEERLAFRAVCEEYADIIRPEPGRYNGSAGYVDNRINFHSKPAPNKKIYQQKLTDGMKQKLAEKMDKLHSYGVLQYPEQVGVTPEFISPSMILPKQEPGEWRLVTDFSSLNKFVTKPQNISPTIQEAKDFLAKSKYHIHVDLSNFFYQSGMDRADIQYLGTVHPYNGLMLYVCEPMGLNGAPEHSYEKLGRVFGPLIKAQKMTRMADGLHIGCDSVKEGIISPHVRAG